jgi:hypothetical protein
VSWFLSFDPLTWWKFFPIILTGFFGVLGLLTDYKDKETDKVTRWGWVSLTGILVSTILGAAAQLDETSKQQSEAAAKQAQAPEMLTDIQRSLSIFDEPTVNASFSTPCDAIYKQFCADVDAWKKTAQIAAPPSLLKDWPGMSPPRILMIVSIFRNSQFADDSSIKPDWTMTFTLPISASLDPWHQNQVIVSVNGNNVHPVANQNNGKLVSLDDLAKAWIEVDGKATILGGGSESLTPVSIRLQFQNGRSLWAQPDSVVQSGRPDVLKAPLTSYSQFSDVNNLN